MKKILFLCINFIVLIGFSQTNSDSIQITPVDGCDNLYLKSKFLEGVIFIEEDTNFYWQLSVDDVIKVEAFIEELYKKNLFKLVYFSDLTYIELSDYKRQYFGKIDFDSGKKIIAINFIKNGAHRLQNYDWLKRPLRFYGGEPIYLHIDLFYNVIIDKNYERYWSQY